MTLGTELTWRAWRHSRRVDRLSLIPGVSACITHRSFFRAQSTDSGTTESDAPPPPSQPLPDDALPDVPVTITSDGQSAGAAAAAPSSTPSLIDRLAQVPIRPHDSRSSVLVPAFNPLPNGRENRVAQWKHHKSYTQQKRLVDHLEYSEFADWRVVLRNLLEWTPTYKVPGDKVKVTIPDGSTDLLLSDHDNNLWNIKSRTGCEVSLYPRRKSGGEGEGEGEDKSSDTDAYVILSGQPASINTAVEDILKVTQRVTVTKLTGDTETVLHDGREVQGPVQGPAPLCSGPPPFPIDLFHDQAPPRLRPYRLTVRADQIPRPEQWTEETFQKYIAALIMGQPSPGLARELYPGREKHKDVVVKQLHAIFNDPAAARAVSNRALKLALEYVVRSGETHVKDARKLFDRVKQLGRQMDADVYNLMAETSVKAKNLLAFKETIRLMIAGGHQPNIRTWTLFLRMVEAEEVRRYILHAMHTKNLLADPRAVIRVSNEMAANDAYRAVQLGQDVDTFLAKQREIYGPEWRLTRHAANKILYVFGAYGKFEEAKKILEAMFASGRYLPNTRSLNSVLTHCMYHGKVEEAISVLRMFDQRGLAETDGISFKLLFDLARKSMRPHVLSVVWRYSHLLDATNWRMRHKGVRLLAGGKAAHQLTERIIGLWAFPERCPCTREQFVQMLLLYDMKKAQYDKLADGKATCWDAVLKDYSETTRLETAPSEATPSEATPTKAAPSEPAPSKSAPSETTPSEATAFETTPSEATPSEQAFSEAAPSKVTPSEATSSEATSPEATPSEATPLEQAPSEAAPSEAAPSEATPSEKAPTETPSSPEASSGKAASKSSLSLARKAYTDFLKWAHRRSRTKAAALPLSEALQAAYEKDRRLVALAKQGLAPPPPHNVLPSDMRPVQVPIKPLEPRKGHGLLTWLSGNKDPDEMDKDGEEEVVEEEGGHRDGKEWEGAEQGREGESDGGSRGGEYREVATG
ncbi:hypothetical protein VTK56DRAFT_3736 [Thermocarpiscus australiensis]